MTVIKNDLKLEAAGNCVRTVRAADGSGGWLIAEIQHQHVKNATQVAAMFAASPDLVEALIAYMQAIRDGQDQKAVMAAIKAADDKARAALAKIVGA
ncbi:hypothetical protein R11007_02854 [Ralstonia holmesii]|nr:hypothetical protein R11007_02854 [Ralstonia sp. LMG 32967]